MASNDDPRVILAGVHSVAVVGISATPTRASNYVTAFLAEKGYACVGVNPGLAGQEIQGAPVFASLAEIDRPIDMIDIFRASDAVGGIVDEALAMIPPPKVIWMQLDVVDEAAKAKAERAGLTVVMNRCPKIELSGS